MNKSIADWRASQLFGLQYYEYSNKWRRVAWLNCVVYSPKAFPLTSCATDTEEAKERKKKKEKRNEEARFLLHFSLHHPSFAKKNTKISIWYQYILEEYRAASYASWNYEYIFVRERSNRVEDEESETWRKYETMLGNNDVMLRQVLSTVIFLLCEMTSRPRTRRAFSCAPRCVPPRPA